MKRELILQLIVIAFVGFYPKIVSFDENFLLPFYAMYTIVVVISVYYFAKFFIFHRQLSANSLSSKDHLYTVYYDIRLHVEMYRSFAYCLVPFLILFAAMTGPASSGSTDLPMYSGPTMIKLVTVYLIVMAAMVVGTELWIKVIYSRYIRQIKSLLDQLREEPLENTPSP